MTNQLEATQALVRRAEEETLKAHAELENKAKSMDELEQKLISMADTQRTLEDKLVTQTKQASEESTAHVAEVTQLYVELREARLKIKELEVASREAEAQARRDSLQRTGGLQEELVEAGKKIADLQADLKSRSEALRTAETKINEERSIAKHASMQAEKAARDTELKGADRDSKLTEAKSALDDAKAKNIQLELELEKMKIEAASPRKVSRVSEMIVFDIALGFVVSISV